MFYSEENALDTFVRPQVQQLCFGECEIHTGIFTLLDSHITRNKST